MRPEKRLRNDVYIRICRKQIGISFFYKTGIETLFSGGDSNWPLNYEISLYDRCAIASSGIVEIGNWKLIKR